MHFIILFFCRADGGSTRTSRSCRSHRGSRERKRTNLNKIPSKLLFLDGSLVRLFHGLANWAIILSVGLPVTIFCQDKAQWGTGHGISDLHDGIQFPFFSFQRTKVTKKYWPQLWVPQWSWFQIAFSRAGILGSQFQCKTSSGKLFALMRDNEALDMIFQTDMMSYEWAHSSLYDNWAKGTKKKRGGKIHFCCAFFINADNS